MYLNKTEEVSQRELTAVDEAHNDSDIKLTAELGSITPHRNLKITTWLIQSPAENATDLSTDEVTWQSYVSFDEEASDMYLPFNNHTKTITISPYYKDE
jgi:hypothetical protein